MLILKIPIYKVMIKAKVMGQELRANLTIDLHMLQIKRNNSFQQLALANIRNIQSLLIQLLEITTKTVTQRTQE
jgi:hypothetical protein